MSLYSSVKDTMSLYFLDFLRFSQPDGIGTAERRFKWVVVLASFKRRLSVKD